MKTKVNKLIYVYMPIGVGNLQQMLHGTGLSATRMMLLFHQLFLSRIRSGSNKQHRNSWLFNEGWVAIDSRILKKLLTKNYVPYLNWAEENGLIQRRRDQFTGHIKYTAGSNSQLIRIPQKLLHKPGTLKHFVKAPVTDYKALKVINAVRIEYQKRRQASNWYDLVNDTHLSIIDMSKNVRFHLEQAERFLYKKYQHAKTNGSKMLMQLYYHIIESIHDGNLDYFSVDPFGNRLHTPVTGLYSKLRDFMYFENCPDESLVHIDIRNSQVYLVSCIVSHPEVIDVLLPEFSVCKSVLESYRENDDVISFYHSCCNGNIYETLAKTLSVPNSVSVGKDAMHDGIRNRAKKKLISYLYSKVKPVHADQGKSFLQNSFPSVDSAILHLKSLGEKDFPFMKEFYTNSRTGKYIGDCATHKNLSRMMQLMESRIILGLVSPALLKSGLVPFLTLHDAFIVPLRHAKQVQNVLHETFVNLGLVPPMLKVTELGIRNLK